MYELYRCYNNRRTVAHSSVAYVSLAVVYVSVAVVYVSVAPDHVSY